MVGRKEKGKRKEVRSGKRTKKKGWKTTEELSVHSSCLSSWDFVGCVCCMSA